MYPTFLSSLFPLPFPSPLSTLRFSPLPPSPSCFQSPGGNLPTCKFVSPMTSQHRRRDLAMLGSDHDGLQSVPKITTI